MLINTPFVNKMNKKIHGGFKIRILLSRVKNKIILAVFVRKQET